MNTVDELVKKGILELDVPLGPLTTYKSGGPARLFAVVENRVDLDALVDSRLFADNDVLVLGRGSNLVVSDAGFDGLVISLGRGFGAIEIEGTTIAAGASVPLPRLARASVEAGLTGLEFFVGVPGSVGGAIRQNAGCFGVETSDRLVDTTILDLGNGRMRKATSIDLEHSYRHSNLAPRDLVVGARFEAGAGDVERGRAELRRITRWRRDNQPGGTLNAGSVFKNPSGKSAGELIDNLGLKGLAVGDVSVSHKHANFFVAGAGATSADIYELVQLVKDRVFEMSQTILEPEIQFVGFEE
ncbi:MAG: UDP-N-acetylmuramate dehydrogenase [Actinomycetota bacterium]|nr:UDP-N-acetylmuramate dehydrogenase [Actinomycetota bacterium]